MVRKLLLAGCFALCAAGQAAGDSRPLPAHNVISEDVTEQRRALFVRVEQRLEESELMRIGDAFRGRSKREFARTQINYFLPGMPLNQGPWASVLFSSEARVQVHGLRREDEELFVSEHRNDPRPLLGAWLTSPPAAPGRLSIYSDQGRIYAEWRLRGGQKTVDELQDTPTKAGRRFDVVGGGYYVLSRSGDLEIWDKTTLIATAERIRPQSLALPTAVALGPKQPVPAARPAPAPPAASDMVASPVQPEPKAAAPVASMAAQAAPPSVAPATAVFEPEPVEPKAKPRKQAKAKSRETVTAAPAKGRPKALTPGDQIAAKIAGHY